MTRSHLYVLLALGAVSLTATACSSDTTGPRPSFACESQGSNNGVPCVLPK
jgi:hypothetical protein